jgi:hypothetical protein
MIPAAISTTPKISAYSWAGERSAIDPPPL